MGECCKPDDIGNLLEERGQAYGDFGSQAKVVMKTLRELERLPGWMELDAAAQYGLLMIVVKVSRIANGGVVQFDSLDDIQGYARLIGDHTTAFSTE